jgi:hypothetical protein
MINSSHKLIFHRFVNLVLTCFLSSIWLYLPAKQHGALGEHGDRASNCGVGSKPQLVRRPDFCIILFAVLIFRAATYVSKNVGCLVFFVISNVDYFLTCKQNESRRH